MAVYNRLARRDGVNLIKYIKANKKDFEDLMYRGFVIMMFGCFFPAQDIHYRFFNDDEILAREAVETSPTLQEFFEKMVKIVPHGFTNPKRSQASVNRQSRL